MIQVKSKAEAVEWIARWPAPEIEVIEIRQAQELADFPAEVQETLEKRSELLSQPGERSEG